MSGVTASDRGDRLCFFHTRRHGVMERFSIHTHEVSGSTPVVQVTIYLSERIIPGFLFFLGGGRGGGGSYSFWRKITQVLGYNIAN